MREEHLSQFLLSCFPLPECIYQLLLYPEIMAFTIPNFLPKNASFPKDPLLPKFFYDEVIKEEKLGCGSFGSTYKACFKEDTVAIK